jgi:glycosyltransferase involved in cell wall biosynthesis
MNILYVFGGEKAQGAEIVIERLMRQNAHKVNSHLILAPGRYAIDLIKSNKPYRIHTIPNLKKLNRDTEKRSLKYLLKAIKNYFVIPIKINHYIRKYKVDAVHTNTIVPSSYLTLLIIYSRLFKPRIKWIWSDHDLRYFSRLERYLAQLCVLFYHSTLVVSKAVANKYEVQRKKVTVLYNGLDPKIFKSSKILRRIFRIRHRIADETILVGIAAVIHENKGQLGLIKVFKKLQKQFPNIQLIIAGNFADQTPHYNELVMQEIDNENIIYMGYAHIMNEFYNGCDIIISNSNNYQSESLGTTIYEAMACEKIVIASNTGGTPEIITDEVDGYLFEADNELDLQERLTHVIQNFDQLDHIRKNARVKVLEQFNLTVMRRKYNQLLAALKPKLNKEDKFWKVS